MTFQTELMNKLNNMIDPRHSDYSADFHKLVMKPVITEQPTDPISLLKQRAANAWKPGMQSFFGHDLDEGFLYGMEEYDRDLPEDSPEYLAMLTYCVECYEEYAAEYEEE